MAGLAADLQNLAMSRRRFPDWMAERLCGFEGEMFGDDGQPFPLDAGTIDRVFHTEGPFRRLGRWLGVVPEPPRHRMQRLILRRLKFLYLALCVEYCVVNPARRQESVTFFDLPEGIDVPAGGAVHYLRIDARAERPAPCENLAAFHRLLNDWFSARAFRRGWRRHAGRLQRDAGWKSVAKSDIDSPCRALQSPALIALAREKASRKEVDFRCGFGRDEGDGAKSMGEGRERQGDLSRPFTPPGRDAPDRHFAPARESGVFGKNRCRTIRLRRPRHASAPKKSPHPPRLNHYDAAFR